MFSCNFYGCWIEIHTDILIRALFYYIVPFLSPNQNSPFLLFQVMFVRNSHGKVILDVVLEADLNISPKMIDTEKGKTDIFHKETTPFSEYLTIFSNGKPWNKSHVNKFLHNNWTFILILRLFFEVRKSVPESLPYTIICPRTKSLLFLTSKELRIGDLLLCASVGSFEIYSQTLIAIIHTCKMQSN